MPTRYVPATDGGAEARKLARRYLGLEVNTEPLPVGYASRLARRLGWSEPYVSNILTGKRRLTDAMRAKLAAKAKE
jgi:transcriptional regulator with XRE-family HTH domain